MTCADLRRANLVGAILSSAVLCGADLQGADLSRANLRDAKLSGADLSGAKLSGADLQRADLSDLNLGDARYNGADPRRANQGANLSGGDLNGADLRGADLRGVDLSGAIFGGANLAEAKLGYINASGAANLSRADLRGAKLRDMKLSYVNMLGSDLLGADLRGADLTGVNLRGANLHGANLSGANLGGADLGGAKLGDANLSAANLRVALLDGAGLAGATLVETLFINVDLRDAIGLEACKHVGPSTVDHRTIEKSGQLPLSFLRGVGLPDTLIDYLPSLMNNPIQFYSCFISYSAKDQEFSDRLHADLQGNGVRCWFAPHDMPIGAKILDEIDAAIRLREKVLLILSENSINSDWVEDEVATAFEEERRRGRLVLFPVRLDDTVISTTEAWAAKLRQRNIGDFQKWKEHDAYKKAFARVLRDLTLREAN